MPPKPSSPFPDYIGHLLQVFYDGIRDVKAKNYPYFVGRTPASIRIDQYFKRLAVYTRVSNETLVQTFCLINRLCNLNIIDADSLHRLILCAMRVASKFNDDRHCNNKYFAKVAGIDLQELNRLEVDFLFLIDFNPYISCPGYQTFYIFITDPKIAKLCSPYQALPPLIILSEDYIEQDLSQPIEAEDELAVDLSTLTVSKSLLFSTSSTLSYPAHTELTVHPSARIAIKP